MNCLVRILRCIPGYISFVLLSTSVQGATPDPTKSADTHGVVEIETNGANDLSLLITEDLASVVDDGATRRVVPVLGKGSVQTIADLAGLRGIDMAVVPVDVLDDARKRGIGTSFTYITKLYNEEFHLLVRRDVNTLGQLAGHTVNVDVHSAGTGITATAVFSLNHVPVQFTTDPTDVAIARLKRGEIAAVAIVAAKPYLALAVLLHGDGLHLLSLPSNTMPNSYPTATLTAQDYPELVLPDQPVSTVSVGTALVVADLQPRSERYQNVANFVDVFFTQFQSLLEPGHLAVWGEVNLSSEMSGWHRFQPAEQWLQRNSAVAGNTSAEELRTTFSRFIDQRQHLLGGPTMTGQQKGELFQKFEQWQSGHAQ